jgi:hypothetical protein
MTGWTLPLQMGVDVTRVDQPFQVANKSLNVTEPAHKITPPPGMAVGRVGLYMSWVANMDAGWTEWLFDRFGVKYTVLHDADIRPGNLRQKFDVIVLPDQSTPSLLHGWESGAPQRGEGGFSSAPGLRAIQRPEYTGGLGLDGALALQKFAEEGGQIVAMGAASDFAIMQFGLPVRNTLASTPSTQFYAPGSLLRIDVDPNLPETRGMQPQSVAFFINSSAFQLWDPNPPKSALRYSESPERDGMGSLGDHNGYRVLAVYARQKPLLSGWLLGEQHVTGRVAAASVPLGKGRVVLIGFRCQFRGQSENTFPLLFNSLLVKQ